MKNNNFKDPVTVADLKVNQLIIERLTQKYADICWNILSEENAKSGNNKFDNNSNWQWVFDPLDGTKDFIQGTQNYAMHLALNYNHKPYIGVVLIPEKDELWIGYGGRVCEKRDGTCISAKKVCLKVSKR